MGFGRGQVQAVVRLERENEGEVGPVHAPYYPKEKEEGWWVVIGDPHTNQVPHTRTHTRTHTTQHNTTQHTQKHNTHRVRCDPGRPPVIFLFGVAARRPARNGLGERPPG